MFIHKSDYNKELFIMGGCGLLIVFGCILGGWFYCYIEWQRKYELYSQYEIIIENKITKINEMRKTCYNPPKNVQFNLDMVNKELSQQINNEIKALEKGLNNINAIILKWEITYKYRFWNSCYKKPKGLKLFKLSDCLN